MVTGRAAEAYGDPVLGLRGQTRSWATGRPHRVCRYASGVKDRHPVTARAAQAYGDLADLAETVEDEWQYVNDVRDAYMPGIQALGAASAAGGAGTEGGAGAAGGAITDAQAAAVDEAIAEIALISDPHKAIDWLSTFPHVVALALDGDLDGAADASFGDSAGTEPDEDSPFRTLGGFR